MREILFRGKRIDNGEWVEGAFLNDRDGAFYICPAAVDISISYGDNGNRRRIGCWYKVDPATVGQYTGLNDSTKWEQLTEKEQSDWLKSHTVDEWKGKRIFEGDIVDCIARMDRANCVVIFEEGEFRLVPERNYKTYVTGGGYHALRCFEKKVIGNIHDNPELLKEEPT